MDYEKILKGIVQIINIAENSDIGFANICDYIGENCPELQESEDERIRKEMIFYFTEEIPQCSIQEHADKMKEFIAWLEKLGFEEQLNKLKEK